MNTAEKILNKIDYAKLRDQKATLLNMITGWEESIDADVRKEADELYGLVYLIDAIQDRAVNELGKEEKEVFNLEE